MSSKGDFTDKMRELKKNRGQGSAGGPASDSGTSEGKLGLRRSGGGAEPTFLAEHKVTTGETLSHIAVKYYKSGARDKWMAIYEANKDVIGDNPSLVRVGQVLKIPKLDD